VAISEQSLPARTTAACKSAANHLGREKFTAERRESCLSLHQPITIILHIRSLCRQFIGREMAGMNRFGELSCAETILWFWKDAIQ